jgi:hypothetical protein
MDARTGGRHLTDDSQSFRLRELESYDGSHRPIIFIGLPSVVNRYLST